MVTEMTQVETKYEQLYQKFLGSGSTTVEFCEKEGIDPAVWKRATSRLIQRATLRASKKGHVNMTVSTKDYTLTPELKEKRDVVMKYYASGLSKLVWCKVNHVSQDTLDEYIAELTQNGICFNYVEEDYVERRIDFMSNNLPENKEELAKSIYEESFTTHTSVRQLLVKYGIPEGTYYYYLTKLRRQGLCLSTTSRRSAGEWCDIYDKWLSSGLSQREFCAREKIPYTTFREHTSLARKQSKNATDVSTVQMPVVEEDTVPVENTTLVQSENIVTPASNDVAAILKCGDVTIQLMNGADPAMVQVLVAILNNK